MDDRFVLSVPHNEATLAWLQERVLMERGEQIEAAFSKPVVELGGLSGSPSTSTISGTSSFHFNIMDLKQALDEFVEVGQRLRFPPGTKLFHLGPIARSDFDRVVTTW